ncbi:MAG: ABC transporter substrate-binding protein [Deltaproteobacteria bacterium]|nr:ABC transporter substrate-binding protein [Deltaproteobacteria bacterium]
MNKTTQSVSSLLLAAAILISFPSCTKKDGASNATSTGAATAADEIVIGEVGSLTGSEATFGTSTRDGIDLAIKQINAAGGIKGKKVRVLILDDQSKAEEAATAATKLITQDKVVALLGEVASTRSLAMAPIAQSHQVPMITPSSTNPEVTAKGNYVFRVCFIDPFQGMVMAKFAANTLHAKRAAILRDVKSDYSVGLSNFFTENFKKLGGEIVIDTSYSGGDADFKSQLTSIKTKNPDVIYVPGYYTEVGLIARQTKELGIKAPLLGGDGWDSEKLTEIGGQALDGSFFSNHYTPDDKSPVVQRFITEYKTQFNIVPDGLAAMGYDAMIVLADAMKRAKSFGGDDLRQAISETKDFQAVTGRITIDKNRDASKSAVVIEVKGGKFQYKETINPS